MNVKEIVTMHGHMNVKEIVTLHGHMDVKKNTLTSLKHSPSDFQENVRYALLSSFPCISHVPPI